MNLELIKRKVEKGRYKLELLKEEILNTKEKVDKLKEDIQDSLKAQSIIQLVAQETQQTIEYQISRLVTLALKSIGKPYTFNLKFVQRRGKTECDIAFEKNGMEFDPLLEVGGGILDVASFALRISLWAIQNPKSRNVFIFDEPFKNINDPKRVLHRKVAKMVKMISEMMEIQIIMVSCIPEMEEVADKIFIVSNENGVSKIKEM